MNIATFRHKTLIIITGSNESALKQEGNAYSQNNKESYEKRVSQTLSTSLPVPPAPIGDGSAAGGGVPDVCVEGRCC